ncbi:N-acetyltransferase [Pontixanthobacter aestiaquae]|uniref:GNAT family N-acetyltransferase n=1 Tax=Pontixanthobacter aestiaquae TaxID=1509367 RepID=A0A844Z487_9SPHN|nr:N-acetyltransferase [Pontixanthobacter aestiaquae]MDN3646702.1 N-acetyltransferase [Pontixanthobacter aestiaquae]MXO82314.1 GNAT family N-acetyltransferase [Pontixanthobacter aestiaquae]
MTAVTLRPEQSGDEAAIHALTEAAFRDMPFSDGDEAPLVGKLRDAGDLTLSLVAEDAEQIVGHIAFSPVTISDGAADWYGLGPVSVTPVLQQTGIGSKLITRGIADIRAMGAKGIILLGSDEYYPRFGFTHDPELQYPGPPAKYFQRLVLDGDAPKGVVKYAPAFG